MRKSNWESRLLGGVQPARRRCVSLAAVAAVCSAAGVPCGNVALREVVRGPDAQAVSITTNAAGHAVLDFGKHQFGWLEVDVKKPGPLTRLSAAVPTARGVFTIDARREGGRWTVDLVTPAPVKVVTGEGERALPAGSHRVHLVGGSPLFRA